MECRKCGGEMWDNREKKASGAMSPKAPDFKCKDASCGNVIWPPRDAPRRAQKGPAASPGAPPARERPPVDRDARFKEVQKAYGLCIAWVLQKVVPELEKRQIPADLSGINSVAFSVYKSTWGNPSDYDFRQPSTPEDVDTYPGALQDDEDDLPF